MLRITQVDPEIWAWPPHDFLKVSKPKKSGHKKSRVRDFTLSISGSLCYHVNPEIHPIPHQLLPPAPSDHRSSNENQTWMFHADELLDLLKLAWSDFRPENDQDLYDKVESLPEVWSSEGFPYADKSGVYPSSERCTVRALTMSLGTPAFVIEDFKPDMPDTDPEKETKQQCPLCNEPKKLKGMRDHVGCHILLSLCGVEEDSLLRPVSLPRLQPIPNTNPHLRSVAILADSVVAISAVPPSWLLAPSGRSNQTVDFVAHSGMAQPESRQKTRHAPTSRSPVLTARRPFGNTTLSTTSRRGTTAFSMAPASTPVLSSKFNSAKRKRRGWGSLMSWQPVIVLNTPVSSLKGRTWLRSKRKPRVPGWVRKGVDSHRSCSLVFCKCSMSRFYYLISLSAVLTEVAGSHSKTRPTGCRISPRSSVVNSNTWLRAAISRTFSLEDDTLRTRVDALPRTELSMEARGSASTRFEVRGSA